MHLGSWRQSAISVFPLILSSWHNLRLLLVWRSSSTICAELMHQALRQRCENSRWLSMYEASLRSGSLPEARKSRVIQVSLSSWIFLQTGHISPREVRRSDCGLLIKIALWISLSLPSLLTWPSHLPTAVESFSVNAGMQGQRFQNSSSSCLVDLQQRQPHDSRSDRLRCTSRNSISQWHIINFHVPSPLV
jgi:hypothetical protein